MFLGNKPSSTNKSHKNPSKKTNSNSTLMAKVKNLTSTKKSDYKNNYEILEQPQNSDSSDSSPEPSKNKKKKTLKGKELPNSFSMPSNSVGKGKSLESRPSSSLQNPIKPGRRLTRSRGISEKDVAMYEKMKSNRPRFSQNNQ